MDEIREEKTLNLCVGNILFLLFIHLCLKTTLKSTVYCKKSYTCIVIQTANYQSSQSVVVSLSGRFHKVVLVCSLHLCLLYGVC